VLLDGLRRQLRRDCDVVIAVGGRDGLARLADAGPFAVVLTDYEMPQLDGPLFSRQSVMPYRNAPG